MIRLNCDLDETLCSVFVGASRGPPEKVEAVVGERYDGVAECDEAPIVDAFVPCCGYIWPNSFMLASSDVSGDVVERAS